MFTTQDTLFVNRYRPLLKEAAIIWMGSLLFACCAHLSIPLPFSPVPLVTVNQCILLFAAMMGGRRGSLAVLTYLIQGAMGAPIFASALGTVGIARLVGPTGGYLMGYLLAAYVVGKAYEKYSPRSPTLRFALLNIGNAIIYTLGAIQLSHFVGGVSSVTLGILPFLPGDLLKTVIITGLYGKISSHLSAS
ncbi:MAG: biotin transporter BioY [Chlamydiota bacterium]|nr:biotin transporter BioY [Chlamydiota bacterium]